jgi:hypothetical protein
MDRSRSGGSVENGGLCESAEEEQKQNYNQIDLNEKAQESSGEERWKGVDH